MKRLLTAQEMRAVDAASAECGMPVSVLMENAGHALVRAALALASPTGRFAIMCGPGNNGGDGLVAARHLLSLGRSVWVVLIGPGNSLSGEPARNLKALEASGCSPGQMIGDGVGGGESFGPGDVIIDALLGTGVSRPPQAAIATAIDHIAEWRRAGAKVVSADLPSGLNCDSGQAFGACVAADATVSFGFLKVGQAQEPGASLCGNLEVADIGIPTSAHAVLRAPAAFLVEEADALRQLHRRDANSHKGTYGHVLVIAGSKGKTGAAALAGMGALRGGAGLVTVATRPDALLPVMAHAPELMGLELSGQGPLALADLPALLEAASGKSAVVVGPGIERGSQTGEVLETLLAKLEIPCVVDADALNAIAGRLERLVRKAEWVVTPHPGEMARLMGVSTQAVQRDRVGSARSLAAQLGAVVALKGARTVIAQPDGTLFVNPTGNAGMASGGTGDVLAGLCGALLAQGLSAQAAAITGVFAHGLAGDCAARRCGLMGLMATDVLDSLREVWTRWGR